MPWIGWWQNLTEMVTNGSVSIDRLEDMATRTMAPYFFLGQDEGYLANSILPYTVQHPIGDVRGDNAKLIREIGAAATVLVKNVNKTLPFKAPQFLSIFRLRR
jgi:beta-glucosidase